MTYAKARAPSSAMVGVYSAHDEFDQAASAFLDTVSMPAGTSWDTSPTAGSYDSNDYTVEDVGHTAQRTATTDISLWVGRYAVASGPTLTSSVVTIDCKHGALGTGDVLGQAVTARYSDANNWVMLQAQAAWASTMWIYNLALFKRVGGTVTGLGNVSTTLNAGTSFFTLKLQVTTAGTISAWGYPQGGSSSVLLSSALGGGELTSGKAGFYDVNTGSNAVTRNYDNFTAAVAPTTDAVIHPSRSARFTHEGIWRDSSDGTMEGRVPVPEGKYLTVPPATRAGRRARVVVKARRLDLDSGQPDTGLADALTGDLTVTPRVVLLSLTDLIPGGFPDYLVLGTSTDRSFDANDGGLTEIANVLGTAITEHATASLGTYTFPNASTRRTLDCQNALPEQVADFVATLITDLVTVGAAPGTYAPTNHTIVRSMTLGSMTPMILANVAASFALDLQTAGEL